MTDFRPVLVELTAGERLRCRLMIVGLIATAAIATWFSLRVLRWVDVAHARALRRRCAEERAKSSVTMPPAPYPAENARVRTLH